MKDAENKRRSKLLTAVIRSTIKLKKKMKNEKQDHKRRDQLYEKLKELNQLRREPILTSTTEDFKRLRKRNKDIHAKYRQERVNTLLVEWKDSDSNDLTINLRKHPINEVLVSILQKFSGENIIVNVGSVEYTLNDRNIARLLKLINNHMVAEIEGEGSDADFLNEIRVVNTITLSKLNIRKKRLGGAFFRYLNKTDLDLERFGVFKTINSQNYDENCLVVALTNCGLTQRKVNRLKMMVLNRNIPICKLEMICQKLDICIVLKRDGRTCKYYGDKSKQTFNIGLIDSHYFSIETVNITSYALKNYFKLKQKYGVDFHDIYNGKHKRDKKRTIDSYKVITLLLENKHECLEKMTISNDVMTTQFYDKITEFSNLEYEEKEVVEFEKPSKTEKLEFKKVFFDFETETQGVHEPYLCRTIDDEGNEDCFVGGDCGLKLLDSITEDTMLIAHNAGYDYKFLIQYLFSVSAINRGTGLISCQAKYKNKSSDTVYNIRIKDSYKLISMPLKDFGDCFQLTQENEVMPYKVYTKYNLRKRYMHMNDIKRIQNFSDDDANQFEANCHRWRLVEKGMVDIIEYSSMYCRIDCEVLRNGYNTFKKWMKETTDLDIDYILTLPSLANTFFQNSGVFEGTCLLSGTPRAFIQQCIVGGRTMTAENEKQHIADVKMADFDAVSLYPSAMERMGFLKGRPKVLTNLTYDFLEKQDGYFVKIKILKVGHRYRFPLMSSFKENGVRCFSNEQEGNELYCDKFMLEDWIKYHKIQFKVIQGYYFDEGRNYKIQEVIRTLFDERLKKKEEDNPIQMVYKLIMNSAYGKTLLKPVETETIIFDSRRKLMKYVKLNYNYVQEYTKVYGCDKFVLKRVKPINEHFNSVHIGTEILSMSKRIMNEVMCLAEDLGLQIFYQDTDSMHIVERDIEVLKDKFKEKHGRDLIGKDMGQFHTDFEFDGCVNIYAIECIFLGKKCYLDVLVGEDEKTGEMKQGYHVRMKGVPSSTVRYTADTYYNGDLVQLYKDLYNGATVEFDLLEGGKRINFKHNKDLSVSSMSDFKRKLRF